MNQPPLSLHRGILLVLAAPSGAGKTTLAHRLLREIPDAFFSVSYTTRPPRGAEQDGVDYRFVDTRTFQEKIDRGQLVEWAQVHDHFYGSPLSAVEQAFSQGGLALFDIDVQGGMSLKAQFPETVLVFVLPPSMQELERRLRERGTDSDDTIRKRLLAARSEIERGVVSFDYLVVNDQLENALQKLKAVVAAERCRRGRVDLSSL